MPITETIFLYMFLGLMASLSVVTTLASVPSLPEMAHVFSVPLTAIGWIITSTMVGSFLSQFFWGPFSDRYGRCRALATCCLLVSLASFLCYGSDHFEFMLYGRFFQGFAAGGGIIVVRAMCRELYTGARLKRAIAWILTMIPLGSALAPVLGGAIMQRFGWRAVFLYLAVYALLLAALIPCFAGKFPRYPYTRSRKILLSYRVFQADRLTILPLCISALIYLSFFVFIPASSWVFKICFRLKGEMLSLALFTFPFGTFCGGVFQTFWGWRYDAMALSSWCVLIGVLALVSNSLLFVLHPSPLLYSFPMMVFGGAMSVLNATCVTYIMKRHAPKFSGNLSSFIGVGQTAGCVLGSWLSGYMLWPGSLLCVLLCLNVCILTLCVWVAYELGYHSLFFRHLFWRAAKPLS